MKTLVDTYCYIVDPVAIHLIGKTLHTGKGLHVIVMDYQNVPILKTIKR